MLLVTCSAPWPHGPDPVAAACQQQPQCRVTELHQALEEGEDPVEVSYDLAQKQLSVKLLHSVRLLCGNACCRANSVGARSLQQGSLKERASCRAL